MCVLSFDPQNIHTKQATVTIQYKVEETKVKGNGANKVTPQASGRTRTRTRPPESRVRAFNHLTVLFPTENIKIHTNILSKIALEYFNISTTKASLTGRNKTQCPQLSHND